SDTILDVASNLKQPEVAAYITQQCKVDWVENDFSYYFLNEKPLDSFKLNEMLVKNPKTFFIYPNENGYQFSVMDDTTYSGRIDSDVVIAALDGAMPNGLA